MRTKILSTETIPIRRSSPAPSASIDTSVNSTRESDEGSVRTSAEDDSFASFDARNSTMALLAQHDGNEVSSASVPGHIAKLEATAATYNPDFLDRLVDALIGAPTFAKDMESSFAEREEDKDLSLYGTHINDVTLDDTVNADTNGSDKATNNDTVPRFTKNVGASNVPSEASAYVEETSAPNIAASVLQRISTSLSLFTTSTKRSDVSGIATSINTTSKGKEDVKTCEVKGARSYPIVEGGLEVLIHNKTGSKESIGDVGSAKSDPLETLRPRKLTVSSSSISPSHGVSSSDANEEAAVTKAPGQPIVTPFSPELAALAPANPKPTVARTIIISRVEELLNDIYGPPRIQFGEQCSLIRAQLIADKYRSRPNDLIRVLEKKKKQKKAAKAQEALASKIASEEVSNIPTPRNEKQASINSSKATNAPLTIRLKSFRRSSSKLRTRGRSLERARNRSDDSESYSTPEKALGNHFAGTPDTASTFIEDNDYFNENESSFDALSNIGLRGAL